jgi:hypothetical protein
MMFVLNEVRCAKFGCASHVGFYSGDPEPAEDKWGDGDERGGFVGGGAVIGGKEKGNAGGSYHEKSWEWLKTRSKMKTVGGGSIKVSTENLLDGMGKGDVLTMSGKGEGRKIEGQNSQDGKKAVKVAVDVYRGVESDGSAPLKDAIWTVKVSMEPSVSLSATISLSQTVSKGKPASTPSSAHQQSASSVEEDILWDRGEDNPQTDDLSQFKKAATEQNNQFEQSKGQEDPMRILSSDGEADGKEDNEAEAETAPVPVKESESGVSTGSGGETMAMGVGGGAGPIYGVMDMGPGFAGGFR